MLRSVLLAILFMVPPQDPLEPVEGLGLRVARGFKVTLWSGPEIANDIYAMTLDTRGRVVVTSQGWIKLLHEDAQGRADGATLFAPTRTGGMGMCFDGNDLLFSGDNGLFRFRDPDAAGVAQLPPQKISSFVSGEHGHHAMRKGPDGWWYLIGGNEAKITRDHITLPTSPVQNPQVGGFVRYTPDFARSEVIAHGFRNPYDFDFNAAGDLFTYDSDCERDHHLPWYTPTRIYHVGIGLNHGWRLRGHQRSYARRDYEIDTVDMLWAVGRGSPTGVTVYRHTQFPEHYRGGFFALDWTFGRVYFFPLTPQGASYTTQPELFLESTGSEGFAPTDVCVTPDGSLLVSIGGRRTRGAIYRIERPGAPKPPEEANDLGRVLGAPQPLDAWSRARWEPLARALGRGPFEEAAIDEGAPSERRVRAIEILTELFGGLGPRGAAATLGSRSAPVRARAAWSVGRVPGEGTLGLLLPLLAEKDPAVLRPVLEALAERLLEADPRKVAPLLGPAFDTSDRRVRQAAARLAALLPTEAWNRIPMENAKPRPSAWLTWTLASYWRGDPVQDAALALLGMSKNPAFQESAVRLLVLALGDLAIDQPAVEVYSNYASTLSPAPEVRDRILRAVRPVFPSGDPHLDLEAARLLGILEDDDPETVKKTAGFLTSTSHPTDDVHYLIVLSRLRGAWPAGLPAGVARSMLELDHKLEGKDQRTKLTWGPRLAELTDLFVRRVPQVAEEFLAHPGLVTPGHVSMAAALGPAARPRAAALFLSAVKKDASFPWSEPLLELLGELAPEATFPVLRAQGSNVAIRDAVILRLSKSPMAEDRELYLAGVDSANPQVLRASLDALDRIGPGAAPQSGVPLLRLLRRLILEPKQDALRSRVARMMADRLDLHSEFREESADQAALKRLYQPLFETFVTRNPALRKELEGAGEDPRELIRNVPWDQGEAARGEAIFRLRGCQTCHAVQGALGPNLAGAAARFSREDLFEAIVDPSKDVAPPYRTTSFQLKDGQVHTGIIAFESADGFIVQTGATTTVRIDSGDIAAVRPSLASLMPEGLLKNLRPLDLADLYAYLRSLGR